MELWNNVDAYLDRALNLTDPVIEAALAANATAGLPRIDVSPTQGKLLHLIARMQGARNILEVGTLGGYSSIWLARALPRDGRLITLEIDPKHAEVARANVARAGLEELVDVRVGPALDSMRSLHADAAGPFDLIFIDADKPNNPNYLEWAVKLSRPGSVIIVDNVVRDGSILDENSGDANVQGSRQVLEMMGAHPRLSATAIQTVGSKGHDGLAFAIVLP